MEQSQDKTSVQDDTVDGCIWLTEDQIDAMMLDLNNKMTDSDVHSRQKRTLAYWALYNKWSMPITYKFDGSHCEYCCNSLLFTHAVGSRVSIAIIRICDSVCLSVRTVKPTRLKLKSPNLAQR